MITVAMATLLKFGGLKVCGCSYNLNQCMVFHRIFRICPRGSRAKKLLVGIWLQLVPWSCFKYFSNMLFEKGALLH